MLRKVSLLAQKCAAYIEFDSAKNEKYYNRNLFKRKEDAARVKNMMTELKKKPFIQEHPKRPGVIRTTPAAKLYKESSQSYMNAVRILLNILRKTETQAADELMKKLEEFA